MCFCVFGFILEYSNDHSCVFGFCWITSLSSILWYILFFLIIFLSEGWKEGNFPLLCLKPSLTSAHAKFLCLEVCGGAKEMWSWTQGISSESSGVFFVFLFFFPSKHFPDSPFLSSGQEPASTLVSKNLVQQYSQKQLNCWLVGEWVKPKLQISCLKVVPFLVVLLSFWLEKGFPHVCVSHF